jgi:hypothetical protein
MGLLLLIFAVAAEAATFQPSPTMLLHLRLHVRHLLQNAARASPHLPQRIVVLPCFIYDSCAIRLPSKCKSAATITAASLRPAQTTC